MRQQSLVARYYRIPPHQFERLEPRWQSWYLGEYQMEQNLRESQQPQSKAQATLEG